jgi:hypothetical protein
MTMEQRMDQLEKRNKRLAVALTMTVVVMCAVVTMAATGDLDAQIKTVILPMTLIATCGAVMMVATGKINGHFENLYVRNIYVQNDEGVEVVSLGHNVVGGGTIST